MNIDSTDLRVQLANDVNRGFATRVASYQHQLYPSPQDLLAWAAFQKANWKQMTQNLYREPLYPLETYLLHRR